MRPMNEWLALTLARFLFLLSGIGAASALMGCSAGSGGTTTGNPDTAGTESASAAAGGAVGGALSGSNANGRQAYFQFAEPRWRLKSRSKSSSRSRSRTSLVQVLSPWEQLKSSLQLVPKAFATSLCPNAHNSSTNGCTQAGSTLWLSLNECSYIGSSVVLDGTLALTMQPSATASCGSFPYPGANGSLFRQYVSGPGSSTPGSLNAAAGSGIRGVIDDQSQNLSNFDGDSITTLINNGYGSQVTFDSNGDGGINSATVAHHFAVEGLFDFSVTGTVTVADDVQTNVRTVSGFVKVYHNKLQVIGKSTFNNVTHNNTCCLPVSGYITTVFSAGINFQPTSQGAAAVNKSETLTFTGCGTGTLQSYDGSTTQVELNQCF